MVRVPMQRRDGPCRPYPCVGTVAASVSCAFSAVHAFAPKDRDGDLPISPAEVNALLRGGDVGVQGRAVLKERKLRDVRLRALSAIAEPLTDGTLQRDTSIEVPPKRQGVREADHWQRAIWLAKGRKKSQKVTELHVNAAAHGGALPCVAARCPVLQRVALFCSCSFAPTVSARRDTPLLHEPARCTPTGTRRLEPSGRAVSRAADVQAG